MIGRKNKIREGFAERRRESVGVFMLSLPIAIFLVAGRMMTVGREDGFSFAELLAAFVLASVILPIAACAARKVIISGGEERKIGAFERTYRLLLGAAVSMLAFYVAYLGTIELMDFATEVMLLKAPRRAVGIIFLANCAYLAHCGSLTVRKISFVVSAFVLSGALLLFALSIPMIDGGELAGLVRSDHNVEPIGILTAFLSVFAPALAPVIYISAALDRRIRSSRPLAVSWGLIIGCGILALCFLNSILILGSSMGEIYGYPYVAAVSTVTAGKLFARMEGLLYMMYFGAACVRVSVCISLICLVLGRIKRAEDAKKRSMRLLPYLIGALLALSVIVS